MTNTRRVKRALFGLFEGAVSKDVVSRPGARSRPTGKRGAPAAMLFWAQLASGQIVMRKGDDWETFSALDPETLDLAA